MRGAQWRVPLRLELDLFEAPPDEVSQTLVRLRDYVQTCKANATAENAKNKAMVQIEAIDLLAYQYVIMNREDLVVSRDIAMLGVRVNPFPDLAVDMTEEDLKLVVESAQRLLNVSGSISEEEPVTPGVETLRVTNTYSPQLFAGILLAAQVSPSIRVVDIDVVGDEDEDGSSDEKDSDDEDVDTVGGYCKWVAYTLFSRHARHQIKTLQLRMTDLLPAHAKMIRAIVSAPDPLAQFFDEHENYEPVRQLTASRFYLLDPDSEEEVVYAYNQDGVPNVHITKHELVHTTKQPMTVRGIRRPEDKDDPYWIVMIPGCGSGWVHKDDTTDIIETALPTDDYRTAIPSFECIEISLMVDDSKDASIELLEIIGRETKSINMLEYEAAAEDYLDDWAHRILATCPHLEELIVGVATIRSLDVFVDAAAAGDAHLQRLVVGFAGCERMEVFFEALSDNSNALALHLQSRRLMLEIDNEDEIDRVIAASLRMLKTNRRLHYCLIGLRLGPRFAHLAPKVQAAFDPVVNENVPIRAAALDLRCKLAFLSVAHNRASLSAIGRLDTGVLGSVLEFAAQPRTRHVECKCITLV